MRVTNLKKRSFLNKILYWLYDRYVREPYIPKGKIILDVFLGREESLNNKKPRAVVTFIPKKFIPGVHQKYIFHELYKNGDVINIYK